MLDSVRISLKVLNAAQLAGVAAAAFGLAWFGGALPTAPRGPGSERPALVQAARAYADALDEELAASIAERPATPPCSCASTTPRSPLPGAPHGCRTGSLLNPR